MHSLNHTDTIVHLALRVLVSLKKNHYKIVIISRAPVLSQQKGCYLADIESYWCKCPCTVDHVKKEAKQL